MTTSNYPQIRLRRDQLREFHTRFPGLSNPKRIDCLLATDRLLHRNKLYPEITDSRQDKVLKRLVASLKRR